MKNTSWNGRLQRVSEKWPSWHSCDSHDTFCCQRPLLPYVTGPKKKKKNAIFSSDHWEVPVPSEWRQAVSLSEWVCEWVSVRVTECVCVCVCVCVKAVLRGRNKKNAEKLKLDFLIFILIRLFWRDILELQKDSSKKIPLSTGIYKW